VDGIFIAIAIPFFFLLIGVEVYVDRKRRREGKDPLYRFADSITSLSCGVGQQILGAVALGALQIGAYALVHDSLRVATVPTTSTIGWVLAFLGVDLAYYAYHRASHRINFFWATHVVHHQSEEYNLTTALRQSWFTGVTSWLFYAPLAIAGVPTGMFVTCLTLNTLYQFWIHTRAVNKLGPLELVLNTPSHHRIHHAIDPEYIDKNYAGVFIVWDRLFGTFVEEGREPAYGTVKPLASFNPFWANVEGFARIVEMARGTRSWRDKLFAWVAPPEWRPADLGGVVVVPPVDANRVKYDVVKNAAVGRYVTAQFVGVALLVMTLLVFKDLGTAERAGLSAVGLATLGVWGGLFEERRWALPVELARMVGLGVVVGVVGARSEHVIIVMIGWAAFAAASMLWLATALRPAAPRPVVDASH
jgi:sterol desaturase/sphingolipid hydroxylase (fatty acid hydroxylase superfamily)